VLVVLAATAFSEGLPALPHEELLEDRASLDRAVRASQHPAPLYLERAALNRELGDWAAALVDLDRARLFGASISDVARGRAETFLLQGDAARAVHAATVAIDARPDDADSRALRARARMAQGLYQLAADDYGQAVALQPRRPLDLVCARAEALAALPGDGRARALGVLQEEIARRGPASSLMLTAFEHELSIGAHGAALARLEALRAQGWSAPRHGLLSGDVWRDARDEPAARRAWQRGLDAFDRMPTRRRTTRAALRLRRDLESRLAETAR